MTPASALASAVRAAASTVSALSLLVSLVISISCCSFFMSKHKRIDKKLEHLDFTSPG